MVPLALVLYLLLAVPTIYADEGTSSVLPEPTVRIETYPQWKSGDLALFIMDFPQEGVTYTQSSIRFRVAVWGATQEDPIVILLNGEEAARIEGEGLYTYEWHLMGSHHLLIRCYNKIFEQAQFNIKAPPPPAPMILLDEFYTRLEAQRSAVMLTMLGATIAGIPTGIWVKRKTKITSAWALMPLGVFPLLGIRYLPTLYMLIPYGLSAALVYWLAREYADYIAISVIDEGGIDTDVLPLDDEGRAIIDIGPNHWRTAFMHVKQINLIDNRYPINFRFKGTLLRCITVAGKENINQTNEKITITCSPTLARGLAESKVIEDLEDKLADTRFKLVFMERALRSVVSQTVKEMEKIIEDQLLDQVITIEEARNRVNQATEKMKQAMDTTPTETTPETEPIEIDQG
jgi:hypothetical protein